HEGRRARLRGAVEDADHRRLDAEVAVRGRTRRGPALARLLLCRRGGEARLQRLRSSPDRDAHTRVLDRHLPHARLLDDADDLADALGPGLVDAAGGEALVPLRAPADRLQQRFGLVAEEREQEQLLLARGELLRLDAQLLEVDRLLLGGRTAGDELHRAAHRGVDRAGRAAEAALDESLQLVDDSLVARGREDMQEGLRAEDLADRRRERRPADLLADPGELVEHLVEAVAGAEGPELAVQRGHEAGRQPVLGGAHGDAWRERR